MLVIVLAIQLLVPADIPTPPKVRETESWVRGHKGTIEVERLPIVSAKNGRPFWLREGEVAEAFRDMVAYALTHGYEIRLNSAYRTMAEQRKLKRLFPKLAGTPGAGGRRTHQTGCSVDITGTVKEIKGVEHRTMLYWWLKRFSKQFNFVNDMPNEPWHWTYVGPIEGEREIGGN